MIIQYNKEYQDTVKLIAGALKRFGINAGNNDYDDLFSEGLLIVAKSHENYDNTKSKYSTYIFNQIRFMLLKYYDKQKRTPKINDNYEIDNIKSDEINFTGNSEYLKKALSKLKESEYEIIKQHVFEELSFSEIAKGYNKSKQSVQQKFKRAIDKLRGYLSSAEDFELYI